jgi:sugar/nucleoside kinase (ribokinase family)
MKTSIDLVVAGHFSADTLILPSNPAPYQALGGAAAYVSLAAHALGSSVSVVSSVGRDFPQEYLQWLREKGIDVSHVTQDSQPNTGFELTYNKDLSERTLRLKSQGSPITAKDVPENLNAKAIHIGPIAREISLATVRRLKTCCEVLSLDPQGMTRRFDVDGRVSCCEKVPKELVSLVDVYKSSVEEIQALTGQSNAQSAIEAVHAHGPKIVIATMGAKGSQLSVDGEIFQVPPCPAKKVVDPTGAGDVFVGAFLSEYIPGKDVFWCACVGSAAASFVVECVGATCLATREEVYDRAESVYRR